MFVAQLPKFHVRQGLERKATIEMLEVNAVVINVVLFHHSVFIHSLQLSGDSPFQNRWGMIFQNVVLSRIFGPES